MATDRPDLASRLVLRRIGGFPAPGEGDLARFRATIDRTPLPRVLLRRGLAAVRDLVVPGADGTLPARLYRPRDARGVVLFLHGGGFVMCGLDSHEDICCRLARASGAAVLSLAYRLAPEHPFPAAPLDAFAAYEWLRGQRVGAVAVAGDSAGANLAAAVCRIALERGVPPPCHQLLFYPPTMGDAAVPSASEFAKGFVLDRATIAWFRSLYLPVPDEARSAWFAPAQAADFSGLPPATIVTAGCDPLRDEGLILAARLCDAGVPVRYRVIEGGVHGCLNFAFAYPKAARALRHGGRALRDAFAAGLGANAPIADAPVRPAMRPTRRRQAHGLHERPL